MTSHSPVRWRDALAHRAVAQIDAVALLPIGARAVVIAPHPDDEVLGTGGLLSAWASHGRRVQIVVVTDGEASHPHSTRWTADTLAQARRSESAEGWARLGLSRGMRGGLAQRLGLPDGAVAAHAEHLTDILSDTLTPEDVVFATWRGDGHPDHEATGRAAALACERRGCPLFEYPVWMWQWATPDDVRVPWHRLRRVELGAQQLTRKIHAVQAHASQLHADPDGTAPVLPASGLVQWLSPFEYVFVPERP